METKIQAAEKVTEYGINLLLANGSHERALINLYEGNLPGTIFSAK